MENYENKIIHGDCFEVLKTLPDGIVDTIVTSPPYFGLRKYLQDDDVNKKYEVGLEQTPDEYVQKMVAIFSEARRVLKDTGTMFLNLGDSYSGASYDTSDKELVNYLNRDYLCENLCGVCRKAYLIGKSRTKSLPFPKQSALSSLPIHEHKEFVNDHPPTSDFYQQEVRIGVANQDSKHFSTHESEPPLSFQGSKNGESSLQLQGECLRKDNLLFCPLCGQTSMPCVQECGYKMACTFGTGQKDHSSNLDKLDISSLHKAYPYYTITYPNINITPKNLIGVPWRVAFALQADGWILRQDIIWAKTNCMPESVTDRCTKSHEYIFLFSKKPKYYFDYKAIQEPCGENSILRAKRCIESGEHFIPEIHKHADGIQNSKKVLCQSSRSVLEAGMANKRSVWHVATASFGEAHFATFNPDLIRPCILAGCPDGGVVLDPFMGAGTTALVALQEGKKFLGIELNAEYIKIADKRISAELAQGKLF